MAILPPFPAVRKIGLFLGLLEDDVLAQLCAVLLELDLALDLLAVLAGKIDLAGLLVSELYELILGHGN